MLWKENGKIWKYGKVGLKKLAIKTVYKMTAYIHTPAALLMWLMVSSQYSAPDIFFYIAYYIK